MTEWKKGDTGSDLANNVNLEDGQIANGSYHAFSISLSNC
jgi:hypothetical protein